MFNKGDTVECLDNHPGQFTKGKQYTVSGYNSPMVLVISDDQGRSNAWHETKFKVSTQGPTPAIMPTYVRGDNAECIIDNNSYLTKGKMYQVIHENGSSDILVRDDRGVDCSYAKSRFVKVGSTANAVPSAAAPKSVFSVGDRVRYFKARPGNNTLSNYYKVGDVFILSDAPPGCNPGLWARGSRPDCSVRLLDENGNQTVYFECFELVTAGTLTPAKAHSVAAMETKRVVELKPCTCDSLELSRKGCTCGAIVKQQWGLRA